MLYASPPHRMMAPTKNIIQAEAGIFHPPFNIPSDSKSAAGEPKRAYSLTDTPSSATSPFERHLINK